MVFIFKKRYDHQIPLFCFTVGWIEGGGVCKVTLVVLFLCEYFPNLSVCVDQ